MKENFTEYADSGCFYGKEIGTDFKSASSLGEPCQRL